MLQYNLTEFNNSSTKEIPQSIDKGLYQKKPDRKAASARSLEFLSRPLCNWVKQTRNMSSATDYTKETLFIFFLDYVEKILGRLIAGNA